MYLPINLDRKGQKKGAESNEISHEALWLHGVGKQAGMIAFQLGDVISNCGDQACGGSDTHYGQYSTHDPACDRDWQAADKGC